MMSNRSPVLQTAVRMATPLAVMIGVYLLFAGHNNPGGGFAAGLVFGAVVTLRSVSGLQQPRYAGALVAGGILAAAVVALAPLVWGSAFFDHVIGSIEVPVLGKVKSGTALPFDIAVTAIVVGLILALLDGLAAVSTTIESAGSGPPVDDGAAADDEDEEDER